MKINTTVSSLLGFVLIVLPTVSFSVTLTFDGNICSFGGTSSCLNGRLIGQNYGDIEGQLDIIWDNWLAGVGSSNFSFWSTGYSGLENVGYGTGSATAEIFLSPAPGYQVTLQGFDLGAYPNTDRESQVTLLTGLGQELFSSGPITVLGSTPSEFNFGLTSDEGFRIQFGPEASNVGIDNLEYTVTVVPLPAAAWLFGSGLLVLISIFRKLSS